VWYIALPAKNSRTGSHNAFAEFPCPYAFATARPEDAFGPTGHVWFNEMTSRGNPAFHLFTPHRHANFHVGRRGALLFHCSASTLINL
jgi:hypothetical protein